MAAEVLDRRTALEEAFDSAEADAKGETYVPPSREAAPADTSGESRSVEGAETNPARVESEAAAKPEPKDRPRTKGVPLEQRKPAQEVKPEPKVVEQPAGDPATQATEKAPISWGVQRDALWAKVPADVRAVIAKREQEIQRGMSRAGNIEKVANEYVETIKPFENVIRSMNTTPREAVRNVMTTATALITGPQDVKAAVLTEMIMNYGVDLPTLDAAITAAINGKGQQRQTTPPRIDVKSIPELQPLFQLQERVTQHEQAQKQRMEQEAQTQVEALSSKPHFEDVREDMADIMEVSARRGVVLTADQAYEKAVLLHPEVSKIVQQKQQATSVSQAASTLARSRRAASTVTGAPGGAALGAKPATDRRSAIEAAWDSAS